jgi:hypothetical protein
MPKPGLIMTEDALPEVKVEPSSDAAGLAFVPRPTGSRFFARRLALCWRAMAAARAPSPRRR